MDLIPYSYLRVKFIQNQPDSRSFIVLFDSGSTTSWVAKNVLPKDVPPSIVAERKDETMAGTFVSNKGLMLQGINLYEFNPSLLFKKTSWKVRN